MRAERTFGKIFLDFTIALIIIQTIINFIRYFFILLRRISKLKEKNKAKRISTTDLLRGLAKTNNLERFIERNTLDMNLPDLQEYLAQLCVEKNLKIAHVIERAGIHRSFGYQIFRGERHPSRDRIILLCFGFDLDVTQAQQLLDVARKSRLYPRIQRDAAVIYALIHKLPLIELQLMLEELGLTQLGGFSDE